MSTVSVFNPKRQAALNMQKAREASAALLAEIENPLGSKRHQSSLSPQHPAQFLANDSWDNLDGLRQLMASATGTKASGEPANPMPEVLVWSEGA